MGAMSDKARAANPYAEHEAHVEQLQADHDALLEHLNDLDTTPEGERNAAWWEARDEIGTALRQQSQALSSAQLARTQAEGFAAAMTPATITESAPESTEAPRPATTEE